METQKQLKIIKKKRAEELVIRVIQVSIKLYQITPNFSSLNYCNLHIQPV